MLRRKIGTDMSNDTKLNLAQSNTVHFSAEIRFPIRHDQDARSICDTVNPTPSSSCVDYEPGLSTGDWMSESGCLPFLRHLVRLYISRETCGSSYKLRLCSKYMGG